MKIYLQNLRKDTCSYCAVEKFTCLMFCIYNTSYEKKKWRWLISFRSSYIATTITMMAWSIMYHSWLTFVLLMWANVVWLCQDQRSFTLKTSPVLVCYAMLLLLAQYIYGMNLYESELPSNITVSQLGIAICLDFLDLFRNVGHITGTPKPNCF